MTEVCKVSKKLLGNANHVVACLVKNPDLFNMVLPEPLDNFVVWREEFLDLDSIDPEKVILKIIHEEQRFVLIWNKLEYPHHD